MMIRQRYSDGSEKQRNSDEDGGTGIKTGCAANVENTGNPVGFM